MNTSLKWFLIIVVAVYLYGVGMMYRAYFAFPNHPPGMPPAKRREKLLAPLFWPCIPVIMYVEARRPDKRCPILSALFDWIAN